MRVIAGDVSIVTRKFVRPSSDKFIEHDENMPRNDPHHPQKRIQAEEGDQMRPETVDEVTHEELENWGRVVRDTPRLYTCYSAEGRWRPPKDDPDRNAQARGDPDVLAGWLVERIICSPMFPREAKLLLAGQYVFHASKGQIGRICGMPWYKCDERIGWAAMIFKNRLDTIKRIWVRMRPNNLNPPSGEYAA